MNIAILIPSLGAGGAERAASVIGNHYKRQGHNVFYFLLVTSERRFYKVDGVVVNTHIFSPFSCSKISDCLREMFFAANSLRKLKEKYMIDVSISFMEEWNFINSFAGGRGKVITSVRTVLSKRREGKGILYDPYWLKKMLSKSDTVVGVSEYVKNDLCNFYKIKRKKLVAIPNVSRKLEITKKDKWEYGKNVIISVGRLDQLKQHDRIIRAFSIVAKEVDDAILLIIGEGKLKNYLIDLCSELDLADKVILAGSTKDVAYYLSNSKLFVMSSIVEGFPNAMVEAMAMGLPIVTTDSPGGSGEIVGKERSSDGIQFCKYGILTPYISVEFVRGRELSKEEQLLGKAMLEVVENDDICQKYKAASLERASMYSEDNVFALWDDVIGVNDATF